VVVAYSKPIVLRSGLFNRCVLDESYRRHYSASVRGGGEAPTIPGRIGAVGKNLDPF
jgi:hypothetical protein